MFMISMAIAITPTRAPIVKKVLVFSVNAFFDCANGESAGIAESITGIKLPRTITSMYNTINTVAIPIRAPFKSPLDFLEKSLSRGFRHSNIIDHPGARS